MSQLVTRCPYCSTSFHVNEPQLRAARGAVRCGSCLQVFRADENIVFSESDPEASNDLEALLEDDDFLIHDDIDLEGDDEPAPPTVPPAGKDSARVNDDEPLIGDAFGDSQWQDLPAPATADTQDDDDLGEYDSGALAPDWEENPWAGETPEEPLRRERYQSTTDDDDRLSQHLKRLDSRGGAGPDALSSPRDEDRLSATPDRARLLSSIEPAPLEVSWRPRRDRRVPTWLWVLLACVLLAGIAAQAAYFRFDSLSKHQPWRGLYAAVCPQLGCELPELVDLGAIRTANLVVRSHPKLSGALVVDAVLLNTAEFPQPFPSLMLSFSDLKNKPLASRLFTPREYLQGELAGRKEMPSGNPVHIAIEIVDPGREAVNYELQIAR